MTRNDRKPMANIPPFGLRMQPDLKAKVEKAAKANNRSLNAEIVSRLEQSFLSEIERKDLEKIREFYTADERYVVEEYLAGKTDNPSSGVKRAEKLETDLAREINRIISKRTRIMGEVVARELEKQGMLTAPNKNNIPPRQPTWEEMNRLYEAPPEIMPLILECLARKDITGALDALDGWEAGNKD